MALVGKKQKTKNKKLVTVQLKLNEKIKHVYSVKKKRLVKKKQALMQFFQNIPGWVRSRPEAFKKWRREDKKKKKYRSFRLQKRIKPEPRYVPPVGQLLKQTFKMFFQNFWIFVFVMFVHAVLYYLFVRGASSFDLGQTRESIKIILGDDSGAAGTFALLGSVLGSNEQREGSNAINVAILLFISLANIWIIRRLYAGTPFRVRDALYQAPASFVPFVLILIIMTLQALPFTTTSYAYIIGRTNGLFITGVEDLAFFLLAAFCGLLSLYWMVTSIIALYAVTLPNMYPMTALKLTKKIVKFRRFQVFRRIIAFPLVLAIFAFLVLLLTVRIAPNYSPLLVEAFTILLLPILHGYYFNLYRSLL